MLTPVEGAIALHMQHIAYRQYHKGVRVSQCLVFGLVFYHIHPAEYFYPAYVLVSIAAQV